MAARVTIRPAGDHDLPAILVIYNEAVATTTATYDTDPQSMDARKTWLDERRRAGDPVLVADVDGAVVGWASLAQHKPRPGYRHTFEDSVYVDEAHRGKGVGDALLGQLVRRAREKGVHVILAGIDAENEGSIALHRNHGFRKVAHFHEVGWKFGRWLDVVYMQLTIPAEDPLPRYRIRRAAERPVGP